MAAVNTYGVLSNDAGRQVTAGGWKSADRVACRLIGNTKSGPVEVSATVQIVGTGLRFAERRAKNKDGRRAVIEIRLPPMSDDCEVRIWVGNREVTEIG